ncbi:MAG TPA: aminodeoxychorismate lyase [Gammaproteobacteria bacterium]|nr:aminodeoxychorismate lyase [Gammaproteobacteria bacterium]
MPQVTTRVNGLAVDCIDAGDRGLLYGDGVFETMAVHDGRVSSWPRHMARLQAGCKRLGIPGVDTLQLAQEADVLLAGAGQCVLKLIVTRGSGGRGYRVPEEVLPRRILQLLPWPDFPSAAADAGVAVRLCKARLCHNPRLAGIKHLNRLDQVLARQEWDDPQIAEGLLLDVDGRLVEGTMSNLFLVRDQRLMTPDLCRCGVAGIMRSIVLEHAARLSLTVRVQPLDMADLLAAEEVFICNSLVGIWPVSSIDGRPYRKGAVTIRLQQLILAEADTGSVWLP